MQDSNLHEPTIHGGNFPRLQMWRELSIQAQIIMELCWIVPWFRSLTKGTNNAETWRVFITFLVFLELVFWLSRILNFLNIRIFLRRAILSLILLILCLIGLRYLLYFSETMTIVNLIERPIRAFSDLITIIPDEFVIIVSILFLGFRGISIAAQKVSPTDMLWRFQLGIAMYILYILLNTLITGEIPGNPLFLFIFSGLFAIGAARMAVLERLRGGKYLPFDRKWGFGLLISTVIFVGIAYSIAQITNQPIFPMIIQFFGVIAGFILAVLMILLMPVFLLIISGINWVITYIQQTSILPEFTRNIQNAVNELSNLMGKLLLIAQNYIPDISAAKPFILWGGIFLIVGLGFLIVGLRWLVNNYTSFNSEEIESIFEGGNIFDFFRYLISQNIASLGRKIDLRMKAMQYDKRKVAIRIRQIYQELIELCESIGIYRNESQTPLEFLTVLEGIFPDNTDAVNRITQAYIKVRYGELPESRHEIVEIEECWNQLQSKGKILQQNKKGKG